MKFEIVNREINHLFGVSQEQGQRLYDFILEARPQRVLELGFAHGKSTAYIAAALDEIGEGKILTLDQKSAKSLDPTIHQLLESLHLNPFVDITFAERSYTWELMKLIERQTKNEVCEPCFDFCFIDGGHTWDVTGYGFFLVEKLLNSKGWLLFDDLNWTIQGDHPQPDSDWIKKLPDEEKNAAQVERVFSLLVKQHPAFHAFKVEQGWGWAQKK